MRSPTADVFLSLVLVQLFNMCDTNGDGVLQLDEFKDLIARIDRHVTYQDVLAMYHECVGDDDVIDKEELMWLISTRGLKFALLTANNESIKS